MDVVNEVDRFKQLKDDKKAVRIKGRATRREMSSLYTEKMETELRT